MDTYSRVGINRQSDGITGVNTMSLVWESEPWWTQHLATYRNAHLYWQVRRSENNPALLAYYQDSDKANRDVWTQIKPGRYLTRFLDHDLSPKQIKYWAEWQAKGVQPVDGDEPALVVLFATTPDDIEAAYINGPASCMSSAANCYSSSGHPVRVYGAGDLAIAYLPDPDLAAGENALNPGHCVIARAICWPERKVFGRVYPAVDEDGHAEDLRTALHALGYHSSHDYTGKGLDGARMLRIDEDGGVTMPYLDNPHQAFDDHGDYLILRYSGEFDGTATDGVAHLTLEYKYTCECCEEGFNESESLVYVRCNERGGHNERVWCEGCADSNTFICAGFDEAFSDDVAHYEWEGDVYTQVWLDDNTFISDFSGERISNDEKVEMHNRDVWSNDEFYHYGQKLDGENWPSDDAEAELERRAAAADETQMEFRTL
jgi:hypothetical protein